MAYPKVWVMRAGGYGEDEETALSEGMAIIGFRNVGNLMSFQSVEAISAALKKADKAPNQDRADTQARQLWAFSRQAQQGDTVVLPLKNRPGQIALGVLSGPYAYAKVGDENRHVRKVKWVLPDLPRTTFRQDLLYSFGAFLTVCRIRRNEAERRVASVMEGKGDPGFEDTESAQGQPAASVEASDVTASADLAQAAHDEIVAFVREHFPDHDLARLVGAILTAEGYSVHVSSPGPDGGADILAGRGPLGLDSPTLCVQVKATQDSADVKIFRELVGTMNSFKADQGLLVCWGGFKQTTKTEARQQVFRVRLWDQSDIVSAIYRTYEKLSPEIQAELPMKHIWMLVPEDSTKE
jgi:restriction system protein